LRPYQRVAARFAYYTPNSYLNLPMGSGKTLIAMAVIKRLGFPTLVVAPKFVAQFSWPDNLDRFWPECRYQLILGSAAQRSRAVASPANIHLINYENLRWLIETHGWKWPVMVCDEASKLKTRSKRVRALIKIRPQIAKVIMMSATPSINNLEAIFWQYRILDGGETFGKYVTHFRDRWMINIGRNYPNWVPRKGAFKEVIKRAQRLMFVSNDVEMPPVTVVPVGFPLHNYQQYASMARDLVLEDILAPTNAAKSLKLRQICSGFIYGEEGRVVRLGRDKQQALADLLDKLGDQQVLCFYQFREERDYLQKLGFSALDVEGWNLGNIKRMALHPASAGHGLNLHRSGAQAVIFFSLPWDAEQYYQAVGRLARDGNHGVVVYQFVARNTIEERIEKVLEERIGQNAEWSSDNL